MSMRVVASLSLGCLTALVAVADARASDPLRRNVRGPDFDADGYADLAFGALDSPAAAEDAGQVFVLWGGPFGLEVDEERGAVLWQDAPGVADASSASDEFGRALGWGDFNGDCYSDLAVGVPGENIDVYEDAGAVHIFYGSEDGLSLSTDVVMHRGWPGMESMLAADARFGYRLEAGDFDGDFIDDLAIATNSDVDGEIEAGDVHVVYGSTDGLDPYAGPGDQIIDAGTTGLHVPLAYTDFGQTLASGDFDCDGDADLAIEGTIDAVSGVHVLHGSDDGLRGRGGQLWSARTRGLTGIDWFWVGALAVGNFDGNSAEEAGFYVSHGCMDLAIGLPTADANAGAMVVLYGHPHDSSTPGLTLDPSTPWYFAHDSADIPPPHSGYDDTDFGRSLTVAQLDDHVVTTRDDLVASVWAGVVALHGTADGLTDVDSVRWTRATPGIPGSPGLDWFGLHVGFGDYDGDGDGDLSITAPEDNTYVVPGAGNDVTVLELDAAAPPVIEAVDSWMAVEFPAQVAEEDEYLGHSMTDGRSTWPSWFCIAPD